MKTVLLTGANGFIGKACIPFLVSSGYAVHAVSRSPQPPVQGVTWHNMNLLKDDSAERLVMSVQPSHLLHLAWNTEPGAYWTAADNLDWVRSSLSLLRSFASVGGQRVVMAGTCAEYDWQYGYCNERVTPLNPATLYGACKNSLRAMLSAFSEQYGLSAAWGRIFFLYGPHEHPARLVSSVANALLRGESALCSEGKQVRDFMHVADVASAFVALLDSAVQGPVNIAYGEGVAIRDVVQIIAEQLDRPDLLKLGARPTSPQDPQVLLADTRRLSSELNWRPAYTLEKGLRDTLEWWRAHLTV